MCPHQRPGYVMSPSAPRLRYEPRLLLYTVHCRIAVHTVNIWQRIPGSIVGLGGEQPEQRKRHLSYYDLRRVPKLYCIRTGYSRIPGTHAGITISEPQHQPLASQLISEARCPGQHISTCLIKIIYSMP